MKILLMTPPTNRHPIVRDMAGGLGFGGGSGVVLPPLELAYMAATLRGNGHEVVILDSDAEGVCWNAARARVRFLAPEVIVAGVSLPSLYDDCAFLRGVRRIHRGRIVVKTGITYAPILQELLERSAADFCIYGECDLSIHEILAGTSREGIAYMKDGVVKVEPQTPIPDLDALPLPERSLLSNDKYRYCLLGERVTVMQSSRGCPFPCAFYCPYPLVQGRRWRQRSPEHVLAEIRDVVHRHAIRRILFRDATFTLDKGRAEKICALIRREGLDIEWWCETRADCLDEQLLRAMREAGCLGMNIGVESGDPAVMETQAKIGLTRQKLEALRDASRRIGLRLHFLLIVGLPGETRRSIYQTSQLIRDLRPESIGTCIITPYPGTPLYDLAQKNHWLETRDWSRFGGHSPVMHTENLSVRDLKKGLYFLQNSLRSAEPAGFFAGVSQRYMDWRLRRWSSR